MHLESTRALLHTLPYVVETMQFGDNLVFWVADKAVGGRMFALADLDPIRSRHPVISFAAGPAAFADLLEIEGLLPAPYLARAHWIAATQWSVFSNVEWEHHLRRAHALTLTRLAPRTRKVLALAPAEQRKAVTAAREKAAAKKS